MRSLSQFSLIKKRFSSHLSVVQSQGRRHADFTSRRIDRQSHLTLSDYYVDLKIHLCQFLRLNGVIVSSRAAKT